MTQALEEYLNDPDFESNRRQYISGKEKGKSLASPNPSSAPSNKKATGTKSAQPGFQPLGIVLTTVRPDPTNPFNSLTNRQQSPAATESLQKQQNLIDFFASIESELTSMFPGPQHQQQHIQFSTQPQVYGHPTFTPTYVQQPPTQFTPTTATTTTDNQAQFFQPQPSFTPQQQFTSPPQQPIRPEWTGAGFGGYTPSTASSQIHIMPTISSVPSTQTQFSQPQLTSQNAGLQVDLNSTGTNPFRATLLPNQAQTFPQEHSTNPFGKQGSQPMSPAVSQAQSFSSPMSFASQPSTPSTYGQASFQNPPQTPFQLTSTSFQPQQPSVFSRSDTSQPAFPQNPSASSQVSSSTGTNPFSRPQLQLQTQTRLTPQATGSNPFRLPGGSTTTTGVVPNGFGWSQ